MSQQPVPDQRMPAVQADVVHHFAAAVENTDYARLPVEAVEAVKKSILDTLGVSLAASGVEPAVRAAIDLVRETGGRPEASVLAFGDRVPAVMAAFANGALAHSLDFDDQTPSGQHAGSSVLPAAFAVAERMGGVTGRDMIAAIAAGQDIFARLRRNVGWLKDWNLSPVMGVFAGTATAGRLLGLSRERMVHAFGVASMQSCGIMEVVAGTGSNLRGMYAGFSAKGAVLAALLAEKGVTGVDKLFEGKYGFFATYFGGRYDREAILEGLGRDYQGSTTLYKLWPAVGTSHSHIYATSDIMARYDLNSDDIAELRVHVGDYHELMCQPLDERRAPTTLVDAKFSLPFLVAVAAVRRGVRIADFTGEALRDPQVLAAAQKVVPVPDSGLDWKRDYPPGRVEIIMRDGRRFDKVGLPVPGNADAPLTWDDLERKFADCAAAAVVPLTAAQIDKAVQLAHDLEALDDATELLRVLA
jgi:2-methylcitrate dehydratase PrpD